MSNFSRYLYVTETEGLALPTKGLVIPINKESIHGIFQARVLEWGAIAFSIELGRASQTLAENSQAFCRVRLCHSSYGKNEAPESVTLFIKSQKQCAKSQSQGVIL